MRKKKVLSVYGFLLLFGLGLAAFNAVNFGSLTGRVVQGSDYQEDLFFGNHYEFKYYLSTFDLQQDGLYLEGQLSEIYGSDHNLQVTGYVFGESGKVDGTYSQEIFLGADQTLNLKIKIPSSEKIVKTLVYVEDEKTSVKISKEFSVEKLIITGSVVEDLVDSKAVGSFILGMLIFSSLVLFSIYKINQHKKQGALHKTLSEPHSRKYIDLDVR